MKKILVSLIWIVLSINALAEPQCPNLIKLLSTRMDFVLPADSKIPYEKRNGGQLRDYYVIGHLHDTDANWYVADGIFMEPTSVEEALHVGQEFLGMAVYNPNGPTLENRGNMWVCYYLFAPATFIIAANGSYEGVTQYLKSNGMSN